MSGKGSAGRSGSGASAASRPARLNSGESADRAGAGAGGSAGPGKVSRAGAAAATGPTGSGTRQGRVTDYVQRLNSGQPHRFHSPGKRARTSEGNECSSVSSCEDVSRGRDQQSQPGSLITVEVMKELLREERESMRDFIREEISRATETFRSELAEQKSRILELESHVEAQGVFIDELEHRLRGREDRTADLEAALDQVEADQKSSDLIFSGSAIPPPPQPAEGRGPPEDVTGVALGLLRQHLPAVELKREDIVSCTRIARGKKLLCKFSRAGPLSPRYQLYDSRFSLKDSRTDDKLFISEHLSKARFDIFQKLLQEKRAKRVHSVFSKNGVVFCRVVMHGRKIRVTHAQQIPDVLKG